MRSHIKSRLTESNQVKQCSTRKNVSGKNIILKLGFSYFLSEWNSEFLSELTRWIHIFNIFFYHYLRIEMIKHELLLINFSSVFGSFESLGQ